MAGASLGQYLVTWTDRFATSISIQRQQLRPYLWQLGRGYGRADFLLSHWTWNGDWRAVERGAGQRT